METITEWKNNFGEIRRSHTVEIMNDREDMEWMKIKSVTITDENNIILTGWNEFIDIRKGNEYE
jgi:hypothetical protein